MPTVKLQTSMGDITLNLYEKAAPETVKNFLEYISKDFYNNTIFHRVIDGFMIQGGGLTNDMQPKDTNQPIKNEAQFSLENKSGTVAMARTSDPHSATSQFFINVADNDFLNFKAETEQEWGYCVFGKVIDGLDIVKKISQVNTINKSGHQDVPEIDIVLNQAILEKETATADNN